MKVNIMNMHAAHDSVYLTCSKKLTVSQLSLPHGEVNVIRTDQSEAAILYKLSKLKQEVNSKDHI